MDVDAALAEVPVNVVALIDDTDFKTVEDSVVFGDVTLFWNFVTTAGAVTQTSVTPAASGDYEWINEGNGFYNLDLLKALSRQYEHLGGFDIFSDIFFHFNRRGHAIIASIIFNRIVEMAAEGLPEGIHPSPQNKV